MMKTNRGASILAANHSDHLAAGGFLAPVDQRCQQQASDAFSYVIRMNVDGILYRESVCRARSVGNRVSIGDCFLVNFSD